MGTTTEETTNLTIGSKRILEELAKKAHAKCLFCKLIAEAAVNNAF